MSEGWLERPWGLVLAMSIVGLAVILVGSSAGEDHSWGLSTTAGSAGAGGAGLAVGSDQFLVTGIPDANTIDVGGGQTVRMIGIAAPAATDCFGAQSLARVKELLPAGTAIKATYDLDRVDDAGHLFAYVYRVKDGLFVNLALAQDGFAREAIAAPNLTHVAELVEATAEAQAQRKGLWAQCGDTTTTVTGPAQRSTTTLRAAGAGTSATTSATSAPAARPTSAALSGATTPAALGGATTTSEDCHPSYAGVCLPVSGKNITCQSLRQSGIREFGVVGPDVYHLDPDGNGIACES